MSSSSPEPILRSSLDRVIRALEGMGYPTKRSDRFMTLCPLHEDKTPSMHVTWHSGKVMLYCFACSQGGAATYEDLAHALGLEPSDLFDAPLPPKTEWSGRRASVVQLKKPERPAPLPPVLALEAAEPATAQEPRHRWAKTAVYAYVDEDGALVQEVVREQCTVKAHPAKRFKQAFIDPATGNRVHEKPKGFVGVPYRLPEVVDGIRAKRTVWLVEGEKDADTAASEGLVATTNAQGSGAFPEELLNWFLVPDENGEIIPAHVRLVADRDKAGYNRVAALYPQLVALGVKASIVLPATQDPKSDLTDHFEAGYGTGDFVEISLSTAQMLAQLEDVRDARHKQVEKALGQAEAREALAQRGDAVEENRAAAQAWAKEAVRRLGRVRELAQLPDTVREADRELAEEITTLRDGAFAAVRHLHESLGLAVPSSLQSSRADDVVPLGASTSAFNPGVLANDPDPGQPNSAPSFSVRRGETVKVTYKWDESSEEYKPKYETVLRCWAQVMDRFTEDSHSEDPEAMRPSLGMRVKFSRWHRDESGKPVRNPDGTYQTDVETVIWDAETIQKGRWVDEIPWFGSAALPTTSRRGKDAALDGILQAVPGPATKTPKFTVTGWRQDPTGDWRFIHSTGAITAQGSEPADVALPDSLAVYSMPEPTSDARALRKAWDEGIMPLLEKLPARVIVPLLGFACESVFADRLKTVLHLQGGRSSYKTAVAGLALQLFAPGIHFRGRREIVSGANSGGTTLGVFRTISLAANLPVLVDDFAPDGDPKRAQRKLGDVARINYNGTLRAAGNVRGTINNDRPLRAGVITTGELGADDSAETRLLTVPLGPGDIVDAQHILPRLETSAARQARSLIGSSLIQHLATTMDDELAERTLWQNNPDLPGNPYQYWVEAVKTLPHDESLLGRFSDAGQWCSHGLRLLLRMLVSRGALAAEEARDVLRFADEAIYEALSLQNDVAGDSAHRLVSYLRDAMASGEAHLSGVDGDEPADPMRAGWASRGQGMDGYRMWNPQGTRIGAVDDTTVYLIPSVVMGVANTMASRADATFGESTVSISSAMLSHGWITRDSAGKHATQKRLAGKKIRVWAIPASVLFGDDEDERPTGHTGSDSPVPSPPPLFPGTGPADGGTDPDNPQERGMPQRTFVDVTGETVVMDVLSPYEPCVLCEQIAAGAIEGTPMHERCWNRAMEEMTVGHARFAARLSAAQQAAPAPVAAQTPQPAPAAPEPAQAAAAPPATQQAPTAAETAPAPPSGPVDEPPAAAADPDKEDESPQLPKFAASCAVLDVDGVYMPDGTVRELEAAPEHIGQLADLAAGIGLGTIVRKAKNRAGIWRYKAEPGVIFVTPEATMRLFGMDGELEQDQLKRTAQLKQATAGHPFLALALEDGWQMSAKGEHITGTMRLWGKGDQRRAFVSFLPMLGDDALPALVDIAKRGKPKPAKAAVVARRFEAFASALQYPYQVSATSTGLNLLSETRKDRTETLKAYDAVPPATIPGLVLDHNWSRKPTEDEAGHEFVHVWDRGASYLAAADTTFGIGPATHIDGPTKFDRKTPGYWLVDVPERAEWLYPSIFNPAGVHIAGPKWYVTETLAFAEELGYEIRPLEAWIWNQSGRIFSAWAKRIIDARTALDTPDRDEQAARDIVKNLYVRTLGMMGSHDHHAGRTAYAPERYDMIKGRAGANILRRIVKIGEDFGRWPVAVWTDAIAYTSSDPDPVTAWPGDPKHLGRGAGQYKHLGFARISEIGKFLTGRGFEKEAAMKLLGPDSLK
ncbi:CHC2 zinc finger domain-containing protein [Sinomonas sp. JGH33]|uniref:CHC2 zinc finger domain-containing protein n=1 Tax=Sinomonas terricola TaxID=3110330 RepID=A0ABU5TCP8_9MICC|nr:CHC2 zinc finger domain-containing protein [Sinomonas sp. JGH33]MEA5457317.1 CHC2 zinc finger domain-containing protein [Sinomonas sp. JGH33]